MRFQREVVFFFHLVTHYYLYKNRDLISSDTDPKSARGQDCYRPLSRTSFGAQKANASGERQRMHEQHPDTCTMHCPDRYWSRWLALRSLCILGTIFYIFATTKLLSVIQIPNFHFGVVDTLTSRRANLSPIPTPAGGTARYAYCLQVLQTNIGYNSHRVLRQCSDMASNLKG